MKTGQNPNSPVNYGASYKSITALAANTPDAIFTPASNVNGAIVWLIDYAMSGPVSTNSYTSFLAKTSAPTTIIDGDVIAAGLSFIAGASANEALAKAKLEKAVKIPAGKGLYRICSQAESNCIAAVIYTLL